MGYIIETGQKNGDGKWPEVKTLNNKIISTG